MTQRFSISWGQAYADIRELYEEIAAQRRISRAAEAAALLEQIDAEVERLRDDNGGIQGRSSVARALGQLWDMRAKLTGAYRDTAKIAILVAEAKQLTGLDDAALEAQIAESERKLLPAATQAAEVEAVKPARRRARAR